MMSAEEAARPDDRCHAHALLLATLPLARVHATRRSYNGWWEVAPKNEWRLDRRLRRVLDKAWDNCMRGDSLGIDPPAGLRAERAI
jgi:hypothetical protein